jgi:hypothetical protein
VRLIWTPEDGERREWSFRPMQLMTEDVEDIEVVGGRAWQSYDEFGELFMKGNRRAHRAALWVLLRRERPTLEFHNLQLRADEVQVDFEEDEAAALRDQLRENPSLDPVQRDFLLAALADPDDPLLRGEVPASPLEGSPSGSGDAATDGT